MEVTETLLLKSSFDTTSERCLLAERETANIWSVSNQTQSFYGAFEWAFSKSINPTSECTGIACYERKKLRPVNILVLLQGLF